MKRALVISLGAIDFDQRVQRQCRWLSAEYEVTLFAYGTSPPGLVSEFIRLDPARQSALRRFIRLFRLILGDSLGFYFDSSSVKQALRVARGKTWDLIVADDIDAGPLALRIAQGAPVVFDAHEYSPDELAQSITWKLLYRSYKTALCHHVIPRVSSFLTVSRGLAELYEQNFGRRPLVMENIPEVTAPLPVPVASADVHSPVWRLVHHGIGHPARKLELLIDALALLGPEYTLDLILVVNDSNYVESLIRRAGGNPRIRFLPPIPPQELVSRLAEYDLGIIFLPPLNLSLGNALPNKFFEYLHSGVPVIAGPIPEIASAVGTWDCGVIAQSFEAQELALVLKGIRRERWSIWRQNVRKAAQHFSADSTRAIFLSEIRRLPQSLSLA